MPIISPYIQETEDKDDETELGPSNLANTNNNNIIGNSGGNGTRTNNANNTNNTNDSNDTGHSLSGNDAATPLGNGTGNNDIQQLPNDRGGISMQWFQQYLTNQAKRADNLEKRIMNAELKADAERKKHAGLCISFPYVVKPKIIEISDGIVRYFSQQSENTKFPMVLARPL